METPEKSINWFGYKTFGNPNVPQLVEEDIVVRDFKGKPLKFLANSGVIEATREVSFRNK